jgi:glyoxylase-like metal-dependent hydrolase (beta-lactamase superfamily II)
MMADDISKGIAELRPNIYQFKGIRPGCHVYLLKGSKKNVLVDTGMAAYYPQLKLSLKELGLKPRDILFVILTHEHFDHIGATTLFFDTALVAAHRLAANKIELQDEFVTMMKYCNNLNKPFNADIWLEDGNIIDLGNYKLNVVHTPGHTSGCICLYEARERLLFSGDTVFGGGTLSSIASSGNVSDYMNSLQRLSSLKVKFLCPGHGKISEDPEGDILRGLEHARSLMEDTKTIFDALSRKWGKQEMVERVLKRLSTGKGK